ncbi:MAG: phosphosulfolactate synthase [Methanobrevibacter sp.]|jgi:phosphosulfolactate synthase|nr:phosphosulfolactate synthase [Candidatus Methanoflexus mossambicus]
MTFNYLKNYRTNIKSTNDFNSFNDSLTMVLDKGMPVSYTNNLMQIAGTYLDFLKFGWGTTIVLNEEIVTQKLEICENFDILGYCGGTLFEIAIIKNKVDELFEDLNRLGFKAIEISDGSLDLNRDEKLEYISLAKKKGFYVLSEVGKKDLQKDNAIDLDSRISFINEELNAGSQKVIIEARESGKGIGIFDDGGNAKVNDVNAISEAIDANNIIWEAPNKNQQVFFVKQLGSNVNLGNISPNDIISLETIRQGLRGDTIDLLF